jgi:hypothetical protein
MYGLQTYTWTDPHLGPGVTVKAAHLTDLRTALQQVYIVAGIPPPAFETITPRVTFIRAAHLEEVRDALVPLGGS